MNSTERSKTHFFSDGSGQGNQYAELAERLSPAVEFVRESLRTRRPVSEIALDLHRQGHVGIFAFICIFLDSTDATIPELKKFGRWWQDSLPSNCTEIDAYATKIRLHDRIPKK
jgi:hypothetical protein